MENNPVAAFYDALQAAGMAPARRSELVADGNLHRHKIADDRNGTRNGWHTIHTDHPPSAAGGSWKTGERVNWTAKATGRMNPQELAILRQRMAEERRQREAEQEAARKNAADFALKLWNQAGPVNQLHPYLKRKRIAPGITPGIAYGIARQNFGRLLLPVVDFDGALHGLQFIDETGAKRFLPGTRKAGHFIPIGGLPDGARALWVSEGWATACTLQIMRPEVCAIAGLDCGNLASVATEARKRWPRLQIVIASDFDAIGQEKGRAAAIAARADILPMPDVVPAGVSDWNDWRNLRQGVAHA